MASNVGETGSLAIHGEEDVTINPSTGDLWFTEQGGNKIGKCHVSLYSIPPPITISNMSMEMTVLGEWSKSLLMDSAYEYVNHTIRIQAEIASVNGIGTTELNYRLIGEGWSIKKMGLVEGTIYGGKWEHTIPAYNAPGELDYRIWANSTLSENISVGSEIEILYRHGGVIEFIPFPAILLVVFAAIIVFVRNKR